MRQPDLTRRCLMSSLVPCLLFPTPLCPLCAVCAAGVNDTRFTVVSHLGHLLKAGDTVMGYDLSRAVFANVDPDMRLEDFPDVVLVKKVFQRDASKKRAWKLKKLPTSSGDMGDVRERRGGGEADADAAQYEEFLQDIERDKKLRANISVYKGPLLCSSACMAMM